MITLDKQYPDTMSELVAECEALIAKNDLYTLGEPGKPFPGEKEPRVDGTLVDAGEYQYGVAMIPAQWVTNVMNGDGDEVEQ